MGSNPILDNLIYGGKKMNKDEIYDLYCEKNNIKGTYKTDVKPELITTIDYLMFEIGIRLNESKKIFIEYWESFVKSLKDGFK
jgi:hypothetical protein